MMPVSHRLLEGVKVVEFAHTIAGPLCTMTLAQLGAEVVKIESKTAPDLARRFPPFHRGVRNLESSGYFHSANRGKLSVAINLSKPEGTEIVSRLIDNADVFVTNYSRRVAVKYGLRVMPGDIGERASQVVSVAISGFGPGPYRDYAAYGPTAAMSSGLGVMCGYGNDRPIGVGYWLDIFAAIQSAFAVVGALLERKISGTGKHIEISMFDAALDVLAPEILAASLDAGTPTADGNKDPRYSPQNVYRCNGDQEWLAVSVDGDEQWRSLCDVLGREDLARGRWSSAFERWNRQDELDSILADEFQTRQAQTLEVALWAKGIAAARFVVPSDRLSSAPPNFISRPVHPQIGTTEWFSPVSAALGIDAPTTPAPLLGENTDDVLARWLRMDERRVAGLRTLGVLE